MIEDFNTKQLTGLDNRASDLDVFLTYMENGTGRGVSTGMTVTDDDRSGIDPHGGFEYFRHSNEGAVDRASIDQGVVGDDIFGIEQQHPHLFLIETVKGVVDLLGQIICRCLKGGNPGRMAGFSQKPAL